MRVLVLGTSHAAALRLAFPALQAEMPGLELDFWGLPGAAFQRAAMGADGLLRPDPADDLGLRKAGDWNGRAAIDPGGYDRIFLVGLRYGLGRLMPVLRDLQPWDWGRRDGARGVSEPFLAAAIAAELRAGLAAQARRIPLDDRFVLMPAPFPAALAVAADSPHPEPLTRRVAALPQAARLEEMVEAALLEAHADQGCRLVVQPRETRAAPFLTQDRFLADPTRDARHMNADYGRIALQALIAAAGLSTAGPSTAGLSTAAPRAPARRA